MKVVPDGVTSGGIPAVREQDKPTSGPTSASASTSQLPTSTISAQLKPRSKRGISLLGHEIVGHRPGKPAHKPGRRSKLSDWLPLKIKSHKDDHIPPRLREKIEAVEQALKTANGPLKSYGKAAISIIRKQKPADSGITTMDIANLGAIAEVENKRNPGLNLRQFKSQDEFVQALKAGGPASFRAVFPESAPTSGEPSFHHVMADVRLRPPGPPSVVVMESTRIVNGLRAEGLKRTNFFLAAMEKGGVDLSRVALIETDSQKSTTDCVMYSLNHALKAHKNAAKFDQLHAELQSGKGTMAGLSRVQLARGTSLMELPWGADYLHGGVLVGNAAKLLSPDFFKHAASSKQASELVNRPDGSMAGRVNSANHPHAETLADRAEAFRVQRPKPDGFPGETIKFSASIEGFRLQEIERTLAAAAGKPITPSKSASAQAPKPSPAGNDTVRLDGAAIPVASDRFRWTPNTETGHAAEPSDLYPTPTQWTQRPTLGALMHSQSETEETISFLNKHPESAIPPSVADQLFAVEQFAKRPQASAELTGAELQSKVWHDETVDRAGKMMMELSSSRAKELAQRFDRWIKGDPAHGRVQGQSSHEIIPAETAAEQELFSAIKDLPSDRLPDVSIRYRSLHSTKAARAALLGKQVKRG